jgi:hypothetical protein
MTAWNPIFRKLFFLSYTYQVLHFFVSPLGSDNAAHVVHSGMFLCKQSRKPFLFLRCLAGGGILPQDQCLRTIPREQKYVKLWCCWPAIQIPSFRRRNQILSLN